MDEGYVRPKDFFLGTGTSIVIGLLMAAAFRPTETKGGVTMIDYSVIPKEIVGYSEDELPAALELMESSMQMGQKAAINICTEALPTEADLAEIYLGMIATGCHLSYPTAGMVKGVPTTEFILQKGSPQWQVIIPILVPIFTIGLIAWGITKIGDISNALVPLILITVGGLIILAAVLAKPATKYIERGGKIPYLPSTVPRDLEEKVRGLWKKACDWEKIPPDSKFVVFSDDNPYTREYNEAVGQLLRFSQFKTGEWKPAVTKSKKALAASCR